MKQYLVFFMIFIAMSSCSEDPNEISSDLTKKIEYYQGYMSSKHLIKAIYFVSDSTDNYGRAIELKQGEYKEYFPSGKIRSELIYKNNLIEGEAKTYYESGKPFEISLWKSGLQNGVCTFYFENGKTKLSLFYHDGKLIGDAINYFENGMVKSKMIYANDLLVQITFIKDSTGKTLDSLSVENGSGFYNEYNSNDMLTVSTTIKNGLPNGDSKVFSWDGRLKMISHYLNGKYDGVLVIYGENGRIAQESHYSMGLLSGKEKCFSANGILLKETNYKTKLSEGDSLKFGLFSDDNSIEDYTSGIKQLKNLFDPYDMRQGIKDGVENEYYDDGKIKSVSYFKNNNLDSTFIKFYKNGKLKNEYYFDDKYFQRTRYEKKYSEDGKLIDSVAHNRKIK